MQKKDAIVLALKAWSIKTENGKFFVRPTACFDKKQQWRGPYATLQRAITAVARKLAEEFHRRAKRLEGVS